MLSHTKEIITTTLRGRCNNYKRPADDNDVAEVYRRIPLGYITSDQKAKVDYLICAIKSYERDNLLRMEFFDFSEIPLGLA